ncbi:MAG: Asp-tRNA(Asn)/Glu-tRNA(Gln) amidotransferase subunit GatC [Nitrospirae bacterium]|nr:Asp-tRNA(Asn)/Glu-tRNA(Gln) amidotransferase subunit GatC [Nitrospirota bacterium]
MEIERVALLARIKLAEGEKELFSKQLGSILQYIDKLNELDTKEVEPTSHVLSMKNIFREDRTIPSLSKDQALLNAPDSAGDFYRVPKIIE